MRPVFPALWLSARGVWALLGLTSLLAVASVIPQLLLAVYAGSALVLVFAVLDYFVGPSRRLLRIVRKPVGPIAMRHPSELSYTIENRAAVPIRLGLIETPLATVAFERDVLELRVAAKAQTEASLGFLARERGPVTFGKIYVWVENRIGLLRRRFAVDARDEGRVLPDLSAVESYGTLARRSTLLEAGLRKLRLRGTGTEFESLREYLPGDGFRSVDWKATARRGRLMVAQHEVERSQQICIALDCGRLMTPRVGAVRKFDYALTAALSVARIAQNADDHVGITAFAAKPVLELAPRRGASHVNALIRAAYGLQARFEDPDYETIFTRLGRDYRKRSLIVLFTDMFDPVTAAAIRAGIAPLSGRHLVMCVLMNDAAISNALDAAPRTAREAYRTSVAMTLADERAKAIAQLRSGGAIVIDVPAAKLTVAILDAYLDVKSRGLL